MICFSLLFLFKQKTAYEMRISDWSSDVCSSDLAAASPRQEYHRQHSATLVRIPLHSLLIPVSTAYLTTLRVRQMWVQRPSGEECVRYCGYSLRTSRDRTSPMGSPVTHREETLDRPAADRSEDNPSELQSTLSTPSAVVS